MTRNLAVIPARSGSTRIPRKNILPFAGLPLIAHSLAAARTSGLFDEIHVSTDDPEIVEIAADAGARPAFPRAPELAGEHTTILEVLRWVMQEYGRRGRTFDGVALIYATAPLITADDLRAGHEEFTAAARRDAVMAVGEYPAPAQWAMTLADDGTLRFLDFKATQVRSQDLPRTYFDAAAFTFYAPAHILEMPPDRLRYRPYLLPRTRAVDIDTLEDIELAAIFYRAAKET
jgi:N-acylneuraminate cytidylyltransferase